VPPPGPFATEEGGGGALLEKLARARDLLGRERADAPALCAELLAEPPCRQGELAAAQPRFHTWGVAELLLQHSLQIGEQDPSLSGHLAALTLVVADHLDGALHAFAVVQDLKARAWAAVGESRRRAGELDGAEEALQAAAGCLAHGTGDLLVDAQLLEFEAAVREDQGRPGEAAALLKQAATRYDKINQTDLLQRVLAKRDRLKQERPNPERVTHFAFEAGR